MPNDRLWLHWVVLLVAGGASIAAALFTPDIGWLRLGLGVFGGVLVVIGVAGALDIGGGEARDVGDARTGEEPGRSGDAPEARDEDAERLREVGEKVRGEPEEVRSDAEAEAEDVAEDEEEGAAGEKGRSGSGTRRSGDEE